MNALAVFGISNDGLNLAVKLIILFLIAVWLALVFWTWSDGRRRIEDPLLVGCAAAASFFFPFVGTVVYMIVRPPEYLEDVREREIEMAAAAARLAQVQEQPRPSGGDRDAGSRPRPPTRSTIDEPSAAHPAARPSPDEPPIRRSTPRPRPDTT